MNEVRQVVRLTPDAYRALEKALPAPVVDDKTTDLVAGQRLGIQLVLKMLRDGFVTGE